ncbi:MAG: hypothetical protein ACI4GV_04300 [Acutalibacteraceae bacterium]
MIFRIGKLNIELSFPLVAIMTAVIIFDTTMSVVICFIAIIMHETGHLAALAFYGAFPKKIKLTLFDIAIVDSGKYTRNSRQELVVVLAGVTVNFVFAVVFYIVFRCTNMFFFGNMAVSHATLGVFNILPVDSLDGGQALFIILTKHFSIYKSMIILDIISFIVLVPVACTGFIVLLRSKYNFTLLLTALYLITVILLKHRK